MSLEKRLKKITRNFFYSSLVSLLLSSCPSPVIKDKNDYQNPPASPTPPTTEDPTGYDYTTTINKIASQTIGTEGGVIEINNLQSFLHGMNLQINPGALSSDTPISVGEVNNPPELPAGLNYVGSAVDLEPNGILFNEPIEIKIPYDNNFLSDAGIADDSNLKLYSYNKSSKNWEEINITSRDVTNNFITAKINHFSYYAITGFSFTSPSDLGIPLPGDLLYTTGAFWNQGDKNMKDNWMPGHVGIYVGERIYSGGLASEDVKNFGRYNVVEALARGIQFSYYNIPNVTETYESRLSPFSGENIFMGTREPTTGALTSAQRKIIVDYVESQIGKDYAWGQTALAFFGMLEGRLVKGPNSFNCVGLAEKAYEIAGVNDGAGLVFPIQEDGIDYSFGVLTPAEQYNATRPASGKNPLIENPPDPDLEKIIFQSNRSPAGIYIMNTDGSSPLPLIEGNVQSPKWNKDRTKIVYVQEMPGMSGDQRYEIYVSNADGTNKTRLTNNSYYDHSPCWSPDGTRIAFISNRDKATTGYDYQLYLMNADGSNQEKLSAKNFHADTPAFSPEGNNIAYGGSDGLYSINLSDKTRIQLTFNGAVREVSYASSGDILFNNLNENLLYVRESSGAVLPLIFSQAGDSWPSWSKDESRILFASQRDGDWEIYSVNLNGTGLKKLTNNSYADIFPN